jgi:hypothetical protein
MLVEVESPKGAKARASGTARWIFTYREALKVLKQIGFRPFRAMECQLLISGALSRSITETPLGFNSITRSVKLSTVDL